MLENQNVSPYNWVKISAIGFFLSIIFFFAVILLPGFNRLFSQIGPLIYYVILIPFALVSAGFLFGALKSYAKANGKNIHGSIELGGPVVVFVLVLWGGITFHDKLEVKGNFHLQLHFFDQKTKNIIYEGIVIVNLDDATIGTKYFREGQLQIAIPEMSRSKSISIIPDLAHYKKEAIELQIPRDKNNLTVYLTPIEYATVVSGYIYSKNNQLATEPLIIDWGGSKDTTNTGAYELTIPFPVGVIKTLKVFGNNTLLYSMDQVIPLDQHDIKLD